MNMRKLVTQTMLLSTSHFFVRVLGFILRIWLSRELGPQAMGLVELTQSAQMLMITPVVSGLPAAVSRMCAKSDQQRQIRILRLALLFALCISMPVSAIAFFMRIPLSLWLGDLRTLPGLLIYLPCIPILGISCALNGYYYGTGRPAAPAISEIIEQTIRLLLCVRLVRIFRHWPVTFRSAIPAAAALTGETAGLLFMLAFSLRALFSGTHTGGKKRPIIKELLSLSLPLTGIRIVSSLMRTVNAVLIPSRLQTAGLGSAEAIARLGMINGMMMPLLTLPSFITCSLNMISAPELSRREAAGLPILRFIRRILVGTLFLGTLAGIAVFFLAPLFAHTLYRQAELLPMLRRCCILVPIMALTQVTGGIMNGLGLQMKSLKISLSSSFLSVLLTYFLASQPSLMHWGVILAMSVSQFLTLLINLLILHKLVKR